MKVNSVPVSLMSVGNLCPWTTPPMRLTRTTTMLSRTATPSGRSWPSVRVPRRLEVWSSGCAEQAMGRPMTPGNPSLSLCR